jgi:redox-sensitive bicupin YhaK (pirin superfamily)
MASVTLLKANLRDIGAFQVRRILPAARRQSVGPFLFFDHFGPMDVAPGAGHDVRPHPHIGLSTVSYVFEGAIVHRDSIGAVQRIEPGAVKMAVLDGGDSVSIRAAQPSRLVLIGGEPLDGHRFIWWNFVSSRRERIEAAAEQWAQRAFDPIPGDDEERIPLPEKRL